MLVETHLIIFFWSSYSSGLTFEGAEEQISGQFHSVAWPWGQESHRFIMVYELVKPSFGWPSEQDVSF